MKSLIIHLFGVTIIILRVLSVSAEIDWCEIEKKYCKSELHLLCDHSKSNYDIVWAKHNHDVCQPFNQTLIEHFLNKINTFRNDLAEGRLANYDKAKDMTKMEWNKEFEELAVERLQKISKKNSKTCTKTSKNENLSWMERLPNPKSGTIIQAIYKEMEDVNQLNDSTFLIDSGNIDIGCGYCVFKPNGMNSTYIFGCHTIRTKKYSTVHENFKNIAYHHIKGSDTATPCSACADNMECDSFYKGLCARGDPGGISKLVKWILIGLGFVIAFILIVIIFVKTVSYMAEGETYKIFS